MKPIITKLFRVVKLAENAGYGLDNIEYHWKSCNDTTPVLDVDVDFDSVVVSFQLVQAEESVSKRNQEELEEVWKHVGSLPERNRNDVGTNSGTVRDMMGNCLEKFAF